jgi:hypothetical protein
MNNIEKPNNIKKRVYVKPLVERVKLDNEISMVMMSPPPDPGAYMPERNDNNPFKVEQA